MIKYLLTQAYKCKIRTNKHLTVKSKILITNPLHFIFVNKMSKS